MKKYFLPIILLVFLSTKSFATPIFYDESVNGDSDSWNLGPSFLFDEGINVFQGRTDLYFGTLFDTDGFVFDIQPGHVLTSVSLFVDNVVLGSDTVLGSIFNGYKVSIAIRDNTTFNPPHDNSLFLPNTVFWGDEFTTSLYGAALPLEEGRYFSNIGDSLGVQTADCVVVGDSCGLSFSYRLEYTVEASQVSEPPVMLIFLFGIALLTRRKEQRSNLHDSLI